MANENRHGVRRLVASFLLTELILAELATRLRAQAGAAKAVEIASSLLRSERYQLVFLDLETLKDGLARMKQLADKRLSLTDCASFEIMARLGLQAAFSFDRDFHDCGFEMLP